MSALVFQSTKPAKHVFVASTPLRELNNLRLV